MKRALLITLALTCGLAVKAQITPSFVYKVPNISHATYVSGNYYDEDDILYWDLHCSPYTCGAENVVASSALSAQGSTAYSITNINDWNHETAWVEGVEGYGIGQWIEFQDVWADGVITAISILNGYVKNDKAWSENSRVKRLLVYLNGSPIGILMLEDSRSLQAFSIGDLLGDDVYISYISKLRLEILDVYPGTKYQDTVISEVYFDFCN